MSLAINDKQLKNLVEARIFLADKPITLSEILSSVLSDYSVTPKRVKNIISQLQHEYLDRGVNLVEAGEAYCFQTATDINEPLSKAIAEKPKNYSQAARETLAIIAYKQPITKAEIEQIRGVGVSKEIMKMFSEREFIKKVGYREVPGRPILYGTTQAFLQYFQLKSIDELPGLKSVSGEQIKRSTTQMAIELETPEDDVEQSIKETIITEDDIEKEFPDEE